MDRERQRLVHRYIDGLASLPERREVERYIAADPALAAYVRQHAAVWARIGAMPDGIANADSVGAIESLAARITGVDPAPGDGAPFGRLPRLQVVPPQPARRRRHAVDWSTIMAFGLTAAAVVVIAVGGRQRHPSGGGAARGQGRGVETGEGSVAATVARGVRQTMRLPDGTEVMLGPATRMRYVAGADGDRTVSLVGEAMFRVVHRPGRSFHVRVAGATLQDLGTVFVVRAYGESPVRVSVQDGTVGVRTTGAGAAGGAMTILEAGASAIVQPAGVPTVVHDAVGVGDAFAWTRGSLRYRGVPLAEVAADLARAYDLDIRLADSTLGGRVVNYAIDGENADAALDVLVAALAGVQYERHGRVVSLYRR
jgi:ferric-dicitrate binding protein FerR (iron transport regulator)